MFWTSVVITVPLYHCRNYSIVVPTPLYSVVNIMCIVCYMVQWRYFDTRHDTESQSCSCTWLRYDTKRILQWFIFICLFLLTNWTDVYMCDTRLGLTGSVWNVRRELLCSSFGSMMHFAGRRFINLLNVLFALNYVIQPDQKLDPSVY